MWPHVQAAAEYGESCGSKACPARGCCLSTLSQAFCHQAGPSNAPQSGALLYLMIISLSPNRSVSNCSFIDLLFLLRWAERSNKAEDGEAIWWDLGVQWVWLCHKVPSNPYQPCWSKAPTVWWVFLSVLQQVLSYKKCPKVSHIPASQPEEQQVILKWPIPNSVIYKWINCEILFRGADICNQGQDE